MPATADRPKGTVLVNVSYERLNELILEPLEDALDAIEILATNLGNALGHFDGREWEARFESPPTFADIGSLAVLGERLGSAVEDIEEFVRKIDNRLIGDLDSMRLNGWTRGCP